jgi:ATP-dependent helicase/nuclease subunit B
VNLYSLPPHVPLLDAIAQDWLRRTPDPLERSRGLILLPTRRAARALAEAFLRVAGGAPLLLPRITALGALDEAPLALAGALDLPPAIEPAQRLATLSKLILAQGGAGGAPRTADRAWLLAGELALLMDEAERAGIDLARRLPEAADPAYAAHWGRTLTFLRIVTEAWPAHLAEQELMNPAARQVALLAAQAAAWQAAPPDHPVLVAGTTAGIPAVARLLSVVARLPQGQVLLPALDTAMDEATWQDLTDAHPQAGLRDLLAALGATRGDLRPWPVVPETAVPAARFPTLARALLPAAALPSWQDAPPPRLEGVQRLSPADQQEEAAAIALVLRDALQVPEARAALVAPDRELAGRVAAELLRHGVVADDSAGEALADTPPAVFLRLLTIAVAEALAPVPLLALLKHPLAAAGLAPAACRAAARALEIAVLRGPRPPAGLTGLRRALDQAKHARPEAADLLRRLEDCLAPTLRIASAVAVAPAEALAALIEAAERLATTDTEPGPALLWSGEEGDALATALGAIHAALPLLPDQRRAVLPGLLDAVLQGQVVRSRRALRGRGGTEHPRVFIWGLLEARLQTAELVVLGGLVEGVWPPATDPGPWLSRPMRGTIGLAAPEQAVGQAAHDFVSVAVAAPRVVLSCPARRDGAPAVPARWLTRLEALLAGHGQRLPEHSAVAWVRALDQPADGPRPVAPPRPCPPVAMRPRRLSVTEIETWLRDPYAIYARHVLRLRALKPIDEATDAADYGMLVHDGMRLFLQQHGMRWPPDAAGHLRRAMARSLAEAGLRPALQAWWAPRLERIADWVAEIEARRRDPPPLHIAAELDGRLLLPRPGGDFTLTGRADRIERRADGALAILDYKTGTPPSQKEVEAGLAPQLPLEAAMAAAGAFGPDCAGPAAELAYWHVSGGYEPGTVRLLYKGDAAATAAGVADAGDKLAALIDAYDAPGLCYLSQPHPAHAPRFSDYVQLARVAEWAAAGEDA